MTYAEAERHLTAFLRCDDKSYLRAIVRNVFPEGAVTVGSTSTLWDRRFVRAPVLVELLHEYWLEMGLVTQTMKAIELRFQNVRRSGGADPLEELELDPLRPLNGIIFGLIQDEPNRLSLARRVYEYEHQYGLTLFGRAVPRQRPADVRSRFIEAFHTLLRQAYLFTQQDNDLTIRPDGFEVLGCLKEVHRELSDGAHNGFRDVGWTYRAEMLAQQWILANPAMREFLRGRLMTAYEEDWMGGVDAMKRLQAWDLPSSSHFNDLAQCGERLLLTIRYVNWPKIRHEEYARAWVRMFVDDIKTYIHAYQVVTGVSLTDTPVVATRTRDDGRFLPPSVHMRNRLLQSRGTER
jgi:hypothetical protein